MSGRLEGRVALITGASRGIGAAAARAIAAEGAAVALAHEPNGERTAEAVRLSEEIRATGVPAATLPADLRDPAAPAALVAGARTALGGLDIVIANAALQRRTNWREITVAEWDDVLAVNLRATWLLAQAAHQDLAASPAASFIAVTSVMVQTGQPDQVHYTASKAGLIGLVRALSRAMGDDGIRVNAVMPGAIRTEFEEGLSPDAQAAHARITPKQALKRRGHAEDVAGAFVYLASDQSAFVTGQVLNVDGGWVHY